ncbi:MAG TPA: sugar phosphate isomerase/epimerase, partial [Methanocorpusculum sp.]|nr:sugar phosphate isomerase/epimerase [Methanocorpusculum sp.]
MKFLFSSSRLYIKDPSSWISNIDTAGFDGLEISMDAWFHDISDLKNKYPAIIKLLKDKNLDISVHLPFSGLNIASLNSKIRETTISQLTSCIQASSEITDSVVIHPGYIEPNCNYNQYLSESWSAQISALTILADISDQIGLSLLLENMPNIDDVVYCRDPQEHIEICKLVPKLGMTFDIGHAN